ncbi:hypothetical protein [Bacillus sp. NEB1478]|uniref:hypothetical protein n=1 Tax=Bacillus sp. NEB1478 TaxID=3073816 RepID=UPI002872B746|nr:hypothetical protein [Bacillus sp. NEB1478]WNB91708.1 hypothetical protein RGB74_17805 [Bacillus sp. NEB1478]
MKWVKFIAIISMAVLFIGFLYFRMEQKFTPPTQDEIQVGYKVDDESAKINDLTYTIKRKQPFHVGVIYANMVEKDDETAAKLQILKTENKLVVFEDTWQDTNGTSGKINEIDPKSWESGQYWIKLYRGDKLIRTKEIKVN